MNQKTKNISKDPLVYSPSAAYTPSSPITVANTAALRQHKRHARSAKEDGPLPYTQHKPLSPSRPPPWVTLLIMGLVSLGCAPEPSEDPPKVAEDPQTIVNGEPSDHPFVVSMLIDIDGDEYPICSAVVVGPRHAITAAHCVDVVLNNGFRAQDVRLASLSSAGNPDDPDRPDPLTPRHHVDQMEQFPEWQHLEAGLVHDIAVLRTAAPMDITPVRMRQTPLIPDSSLMPVTTDIAAVIIGYGDDSADDIEADRREGFVRIVQIGPANMVHMPADERLQKTCSGDSGGGVFVLAPDGELELVGTIVGFENAAGGTAPCGVDLSVPHHNVVGWLNSIINGEFEGCEDCPCEEACHQQEDGSWCEPTLCYGYTCADALACTAEVGTSTVFTIDEALAYTSCSAAAGNAHALHAFYRLEDCRFVACRGDANEELYACMEDRCAQLLTTCLEDPHGGAPPEPEPDMSVPDPEPEPDIGPPDADLADALPIGSDRDAGADGGFVVVPGMGDVGAEGCTFDTGSSGSSAAWLLGLLVVSFGRRRRSHVRPRT